MPLVDAVVIGGMKCGTTALHGYLADHPGVTPSEPKEVNFFFGDEPAAVGNWWRGPAWYRGRFPSGDGSRMEASPGYTSPDHPAVAARMRRMVPEVRLLYLGRDPLDRAVSQYRHHRRDGDETRPLDAALLDPDSQYLGRSRHLDRLRPFLDRFPEEQLAVVRHEDLLHDRRRTLSAVFRWLDLDPDHWSSAYGEEHNAAPTVPPVVPLELRERFRARLADDVAAFEEVADRLSIAADRRPGRAAAPDVGLRDGDRDREVA